MKINPDIGQPPPNPALPTPPLPVPTGDPSPFAAMLSQPAVDPAADHPGSGLQGDSPRPGQPIPEATDPASSAPVRVEPGRAKPVKTEAARPEPAPDRDPPGKGREPKAPTISEPTAWTQAAALSPATPIAATEPARLEPVEAEPVNPVLKPGSTAPEFALEAPQPTSTPKPSPWLQNWTIHGLHGRPIFHRAFGFRELGVWGRGGPIAEVAGPRSCGVAPEYGGAKAGAGVTAPDHAVQLDPWANGPDRAERRDVAGARAPGDDRASDAPRPTRPARPSGATHRHSVDRPGQLQVGEKSLDEEIEPITTEGSELPSAPAENSAPLNVSVSDGADGLQVVVALADINPDAVARLRRIAQSLAREFGLSLAEFSLNGAVVDAPAMSDRSPQWR